MYYSLIGLLAALTLLISNHDVLLGRADRAAPPIQRLYRRFLIFVMAYYITDILWGVLDTLSLPALLFADTEVYFLAMATGVLLWTWYITEYLKDESMFRTVLHHGGQVIFAFIVGLTLVNLRLPVLFWYDENGTYLTGSMRYVVLAVQILLFLLTAVYALHVAARAAGSKRSRYLTTGLFGLIMGALLSIQLFFPLIPLYSIGYMLGTCLLRTFVIENENREYREELEAAFDREYQQQEELNSAWRLAYTDALTGVKSKLAFSEKEHLLDAAIADGTAGRLAVVVFDLNGLKRINDTMGHDTGDRYIKAACRLICETFRHSPVYRVGGDEFVAVLEGTNFENREDLLAMFYQQVEENRRTGRVDISAGLAVYSPGRDSSFERMFDRADRLMYRQKEALKRAERSSLP